MSAGGTGCADNADGYAAVTGWGDANGWTASVDAARTVGTANATATKPLSDNGVYAHMGVNPVPSAHQARRT